MVWMLIAVPSSAVVMGIFLITTAVVTWDGLVVDDYYKRGKEINMVIDRDRFATRHGLAAVMAWNPDTGVIRVSMDSAAEVAPDPLIGLNFVHPTRSGHDLRVNLAPGPDGAYHGLAPTQMVAGEWIVQLETEAWRLVARTRLEGEPLSIRLQSLPES